MLSSPSSVGLLALASIVSTSTAQSYVVNNNTNCGTASDIDYQGNYYYVPTDTMDWGFYARSQGNCDSGSSGKITLKDPIGNELDCGYLPLDGKLNLISCSNYPRGYMTEGQYTLIIDTVPGSKQYSWNQFTVVHSQSTVTAPTPTSTITTTPISMQTATVTSTPTTTQLIAQKTITLTTASVTNYIRITPAATTTTSTTTKSITIPLKIYTTTTLTTTTTLPCSLAKLTPDKVTTSNGRTGFFNPTLNLHPRTPILTRVNLIRHLRLRDDIPNTIGISGPAPTTTVTPDTVLSTTTTASPVTSTVTSTSTAPVVTVTSANPVPTVTRYRGAGCATSTTTLAQSTRTVVRERLGVTVITNTVTVTQTRRAVGTPVCRPTER